MNDVCFAAVTMVFPEDRVMAKMFNEEMATFYEKYYADKGVKFIKEDVATGFEGDGKVEGVNLASLCTNTSLQHHLMQVICRAFSYVQRHGCLHDPVHESDNHHHPVIHVLKLSAACLYCCHGKRMTPITRSAEAGVVQHVSCANTASLASKQHMSACSCGAQEWQED